MENWIKINGYERYSVSDQGRVRNNHTGRILKYGDSSGYKSVGPIKNGKQKTFLIHRLIAIAFIPNPNNKGIVNHIDGDKYNNSISNLEWVTSSENQKHAYKIGLKIPSKTCGGPKKPIKCLENGVIYESISLAAKELGLWTSNISRVVDCDEKTTGGYRFEQVKK